MEILVKLIVERKEDHDGPSPRDTEVAAVAQDLLADATKHDHELGWRVTAVIPQV